MDVLLDRRPLSVHQSLTLAHALAATLARMEEQGLAHCDLSAPNLLLPGLATPPSSTAAVELVDVEQLFGRGARPAGPARCRLVRLRASRRW